MIRDLTLADALSVIESMRPQDRACVSALLGDVSDEVFAVDRFQSNGAAWSIDGALLGVSFPNDWTAVWWLIARRDFHSWRKLIRHARTVLSNVANPGNNHYRHRIEAYVLSSWVEAGEFVRHMGFHRESVRRQAGRNGEDIEVWVILGPVRSD